MYNKEEPIPTIKNLDIKEWEHFMVGTFKKADTKIEDSISNTLERLLRISPKIKKSSKVLIFSDGNSFLPVYIASKYRCKISVIATNQEVVDRILKDAKKYEVEDNIVATIDDFTLTSFTHEYFNMIWSVGAIDKTQNLTLTMKEVKRLLVPQGRFILCELAKTENIELENIPFSMEEVMQSANKADLEKVYEKALTKESIAHYDFLAEAYKKDASKLKKSLGEKPYKTSLETIQKLASQTDGNHAAWGFMQFQKRNA